MAKHKYKFALFSVILIVLCIIAFVPSLFFSAPSLNGEDSIPLMDKYNVKVGDGPIKIMGLPQKRIKAEGEKVTLSCHLPDYSTRVSINPTLLLRSSQQKIAVYIDSGVELEKIKLYSFGYTERSVYGKTIGSAYHLVRLPADYVGKTLIVEIEGAYANRTMPLNDILIGTKASHIFAVLQRQLPGTIAAMMLIIIGIIEVITYFFMFRFGDRSLNILYLALFSTLAGVWAISENRLLQLIYNNPFSLYILGMIALFLLPIPFVFFMLKNFTIKNEKPLIIMLNVMFAFDIVALFLQISGLYDFYEIVPIFHVLMIALIVVAIYSAIKSVKENPQVNIFFAGVLVLSATIIIDILFYYFGFIKTASTFTQFGIVIFTILMVVHAGRDYVKFTKTNAVNVALRQLAYTDILTEVKNRTAFQEKMSELNGLEEENGEFAFVVADINDLKNTNDKFGHKKGDDAIKNTAKVLKRAFDKLGEIYRIGGDEFVIILENANPVKCDEALSNLAVYIEACNVQNPKFPLGLAYGIAFFDAKRDTDVNDLFARADEEMYKMKVEFKIGRNDSIIF